MALDIGSKTIGIATSDVMRTLATPLTTLKRGKLAADLAALAELARKHEAGPGDRPAAQHGRHGRAALPVGPPVRGQPRAARPAGARRPAGLFQDERLSTAAVTRGMIDDYDMSRAKRAERVDAAAAAWILESALARLSRELLQHDVVRQPLDLAARADVEGDFPAAGPSAASPLRRDSGRCLPTAIGAGVPCSRPAGASTSTSSAGSPALVQTFMTSANGWPISMRDRLGPQRQHVALGEDDDAGAVPEIERAIGRPGRSRRQQRAREQRQRRPSFDDSRQ